VSSPRPGWPKSGALLDSASELGGGAEIRPIPIVEGYGAWAEAYDLPGNQLIDLEQPIVREILDSLPRGTAPGLVPGGAG